MSSRPVALVLTVLLAAATVGVSVRVDRSMAADNAWVRRVLDQGLTAEAVVAVEPPLVPEGGRHTPITLRMSFLSDGDRGSPGSAPARLGQALPVVVSQGFFARAHKGQHVHFRYFANNPSHFVIVEDPPDPFLPLPAGLAIGFVGLVVSFLTYSSLRGGKEQSPDDPAAESEA
ncbi:MAG: hypothetical protein HYU66_02660 [Armatimonadetes bacterium]|nr:hypothetical protein [Armatimonadota bacterium]